ncbi:MAG TPA: FAD-dependent oxidoreductase, partial [Acidimicrobiales bacterium]
MRPSFHGHNGAALRRAAAVSAEARATGAPVDEVAEQAATGSRAHKPRFDRRTLLKGMGAAGGTVAVVPVASRAKRRSSTPRVVIVGGGLAGIRCAHKLWTERKLASTVYEWDHRLGGRVHTIRGVFANDQIVEACGQFISSEHYSMLRLAKRFRLTLVNTDTYAKDTVNTYWLNDGRYTQAMLNTDWHDFGWSLFQRAAAAAPWPITYRNHTPKSVALDSMSAAEWIDTRVPGGLNSDFGRLCYLDVESEYGGPPEEQSALNLIYLLAYDNSNPGTNLQPKQMPVLGGSDEKWRVDGGNDQIVSGMLSQLPPGSTRTGQQLVALRDNGNRTYTCTFDVDGVATDVVADHVVLTIPFNKLKEVDLRRATLSPLKRKAINSLVLGNNAKVALQVAGTPWRADGYNGNMFAQNLTVSGWDNSVGQPSSTPIFFDYLGGQPGASLAGRYGLVDPIGTTPSQLVVDFLGGIEPVFPGFTDAWNAGPRLSLYSDPNINPRLGGSYSQYRVGQYTGVCGIEGVREGNIHF